MKTANDKAQGAGGGFIASGSLSTAGLCPGASSEK